VFEGLEAVQESEQTNILDYPAVQDIAIRMGYPETALWFASTGMNTPRVYFAGSRPPSRGSPPPYTSTGPTLGREVYRPYQVGTIPCIWSS
jgi:hypothetical protein